MSRQRIKPSPIDPVPAAGRARSVERESTSRAGADSVPRASADSAVSRIIRVLCVDDHAVLVEGLKAQFAIDGGIEVVGRLATAARLVDEVERLRPGAVLLDIEMPGPDVFEMADRMRHAHPRTRFVFLSAHVRDGYLAAAYKCGGWGYFAKADDLEDIVTGVHEVARSTAGTFVMGPKVRERCGQWHGTPTAATRGQTPDPPLTHLTPREVEVLRLIGKGLSRVQIAKELSRSAKTVDGHQDRLMRKLGIGSRADLMRFAIREGLAEA